MACRLASANAGILLIGPFMLIQENAFENVVCEIASTLSQPKYIKSQILYFMIAPRNHFIFRGNTLSINSYHK